MEREEIITKVKLRCDELGPFETGQVIDPGEIDHLLNDAVKRLLLVIPPYVPTPESFLPDSGEVPIPDPETGGSSGIVYGQGVPYDEHTGYIPLPSDFLRLVSLKMTCWERAATRTITEMDHLYTRQSNPYIRGSHTKPVVVLRYEPGIGKVLEYYSVTNNDHRISKGLYIPLVLPEELEDELIDPLSWLVAAILLDTKAEYDAAKAANQRLVEWINSVML